MIKFTETLKIKKFFLLAAMAVTLHTYCQETSFEHFYTSPVYLNPAFAGDTYGGRINIQNRLQFTNFGKPFYSSYFSYDGRLNNSANGWAADAVVDKYILFTTAFNLYFTHTARLSRTTLLKGGLSAGIHLRGLNSNNLTFVDQYNDFGLTGEPTQDLLVQEKVIYPAIGAGILVYSNLFWIGTTAKNINIPNYSLLEGDQYRLPVFYSLHGGVAIPLNQNLLVRRLINRRGGRRPISGINPAFKYTYQSGFHNLYLGSSIYIYPVMIGFSYQFSPLHNVLAPEFIPTRSGALMAGIKTSQYLIHYTFDYALNSEIISNKTAHEFSVIIFLDRMNFPGRRTKIPLTPLPANLFY